MDSEVLEAALSATAAMGGCTDTNVAISGALVGAVQGRAVVSMR